jgi:glutathione peroxidase
MTKYLIITFTFLFAVSIMACVKNPKSDSKSLNGDPVNISDIKVRTMDGSEKSLSDYKGKVVLIVNVASKCGYTPQYEALEKIYETYKDKGFEILGFPCNDFGGQEPGTDEEIVSFCKTNYNVSFTLFDKIKVLGNEKSPLYTKLIAYNPAGDISWNFEKFVIDKKGNVVGRFKSKIKPDSDEVTSLIVSELAK